MDAPAADDKTLRALVDRLIPADDFPSAWDAGAGDFLHRALSTDRADVAGQVWAGLGCLDEEAAARRPGSSYADLAEADQDLVLDDLAHGRTRTSWSAVGAAQFAALMSGLVAQGFYGDPGNGGNREGASWAMIGYRERPVSGDWPPSRDERLATTLPGQVAGSYDAIVIGSGAGGGVAACVLAEAGLRVLVIERGGLLGALRLDHLRAERAPWGYDRPTAAPRVGNPRVVPTHSGEALVDPSDARWSAIAFTVGGGTRVFGAQAWRFSPEDFRMASVYGVPEGSSLADWPIGYDDLEPFYDQAEWELGVCGDAAGNSAEGPRARGYPMAPMPLTTGGARLQAGAERLGLRTGPLPLLINSTERAGRPACSRCGACVGFACPSGAKNGIHNTVLPRALATGRCDLLVESQVTRITRDADGRVDGVVVAGHSPSMWRREINAGQVVVAAGAIESARLLLNSGLGSDHVGRHLQAHVYAGAIGFFDEPVQESVGPGPSIATNDWRHGNDGVIGGAMLADDFVPTPVTAWETLTEVGAIPSYGDAGKRGMRELYPRMQRVFGPVQEVPNPQARVTVDPAVHDALGSPVARLSGDIHPEDRVTARFIADRAAEWLEASGVRDVARLTADDRPEGPSGGQHQAGTLRMGDNPETSVTDCWGRVWGHDNLLVADGSVHVTNGGVNPVLTIMALAYRNAGHLVETLRAGPGRR
jgi:choline dehydrogenase-like flavoprotein